MIKLYFDAKTYSFYQQIRKEKSTRGNQAVKRIHDPQLKKVIYLVIIMLMPKLFLQKPSKKLNAKNTNLLWNTIYNNATIKENYSERKTIPGMLKILSNHHQLHKYLENLERTWQYQLSI